MVLSKNMESCYDWIISMMIYEVETMLDDSIDRKSFSVHNLHDHENDLQYWLSQTPQDRIAAIEMLRRINYGNDVSTARLQRFFEVAEFPQS
jgi:hypothetical protein